MTKAQRVELNNRLLLEAEQDLAEKRKKLMTVQFQEPHIYTTSDPTEQPMGAIYRRKNGGAVVEVKGEPWKDGNRMSREEFKRA